HAVAVFRRTHLRTPPRLLLCDDAPPTPLSTLSLHDALPIFWAAIIANIFNVVADMYLIFGGASLPEWTGPLRLMPAMGAAGAAIDRKSTRLNSSHVKISYAVFCLKKKKRKTQDNLNEPYRAP